MSKQFQKKAGSGEDKTLSVLNNVSFSVQPEEVVVLIGPSGCGKTTLLKIMHGLIRSDAGSVLVDGAEVSGPSFNRGLVFQDAGLLPWRSVLKNVEFGLEMKGVGREERQRRARDQLDIVGLSNFERYYPHQLSGGMQQRVGIARALAIDPEILLMDEPFGSVDAQTRERLQFELLRINSVFKKTVIFVTHDLDEAIYLADRVVVLGANPGRVKDIVPVRLPRPRSSPALAKGDPEFVAKRQLIWELISDPTE